MTKTFKNLRKDILDEQHFSHVGKDVSQKLSYDNWLKKVKGIEKGAHGIKGPEHTKFSKQWKDYKGKDKLAASYNEQVELQEGRMKELHTLIQQGKSAEEIAKIMKLDVKTIKSLMPKEESKMNPSPTKHMGGGQYKVDPKLAAIRDKKNKARDKLIKQGKYKAEEVNEVSPPGWGGSVKAMKKHADIDNPYALAWHMKNKGDKPHYKDKDGPPVKKDKYKDEQMEQAKLKEMALSKIKIPTVDVVSYDGSNPNYGLLPNDERKLVSAARGLGLVVKKRKADGPGAIYSVRDKDTKKLNRFADALSRGIQGSYLMSYTGDVTEPGAPNDFRTGTRQQKGNTHWDADDTRDWNYDKGKTLRSEFLPAGEEELTEKLEVKWDKDKEGWYDKKGRRRYLGKAATQDLLGKQIAKAKASGDWSTFDLDRSRFEEKETDMKKEDHDCAKVHPDKPHQEWAKGNLKKAHYETHKYFDTKPGSIEASVVKMKELEETAVTVNKKQLDDLVKQYLAKGGTVTKLPPALKPSETPPKEWDLVKGKSVPGSGQGQIAYKVKRVGGAYKILKAHLREFIRVYNEHFLTNYAAEEFIVEEEK